MGLFSFGKKKNNDDLMDDMNNIKSDIDNNFFYNPQMQYQGAYDQFNMNALQQQQYNNNYNNLYNNNLNSPNNMFNNNINMDNNSFFQNNMQFQNQNLYQPQIPQVQNQPYQLNNQYNQFQQPQVQNIQPQIEENEKDNEMINRKMKEIENIVSKLKEEKKSKERKEKIEPEEIIERRLSIDKEERELYIKLEDYKRLIELLNKIKTKLKDIEDILNDIKNLKKQELDKIENNNEKLSQLRESIDDVLGLLK